MTRLRKHAILAVALLGFGFARMPYEAHLTKEFRSTNLLPKPLQIGTIDHLGQTSAAIAIGGMRTLVATFLNIRAYTAFTEHRWRDLEDNFRTIFDLAPHTTYYWQTGAWHLAYNEAAYHINEDKKSPLRRREEWREAIQKGRAILEQGIRNNPDNPTLHSELGYLLSDRLKYTAFNDPNTTYLAAAEAYHKAYAYGALEYTKRSELYALARVRGKENEALALAQKYYDEGIKNHTPTLLCVLFALEFHHNPQLDAKKLALKLFDGDEKKAYEHLSNYWSRAGQRFPMDGVAKTLRLLENDLKIPAKDSILNRPQLPPPSPDDWFSQ